MERSDRGEPYHSRSRSGSHLVPPKMPSRAKDHVLGSPAVSPKLLSWDRRKLASAEAVVQGVVRGMSWRNVIEAKAPSIQSEDDTQNQSGPEFEEPRTPRSHDSSQEGSAGSANRPRLHRVAQIPGVKMHHLPDPSVALVPEPRPSTPSHTRASLPAPRRRAGPTLGERIGEVLSRSSSRAGSRPTSRVPSRAGSLTNIKAILEGAPGILDMDDVPAFRASEPAQLGTGRLSPSLLTGRLSPPLGPLHARLSAQGRGIGGGEGRENSGDFRHSENLPTAINRMSFPMPKPGSKYDPWRRSAGGVQSLSPKNNPWGKGSGYRNGDRVEMREASAGLTTSRDGAGPPTLQRAGGGARRGGRTPQGGDSKQQRLSSAAELGFVLGEWPPGASSGGEQVRYIVLLDSGARVKARVWQLRLARLDEEGVSKAAALGLLEVVRRWKDAGGGLQFRDAAGLTPLMRACASGSWETVHFLVEEEAKCFMHPKLGGFTAFEMAFINGNVPVIQYIVRHKIASPKSDGMMDTEIAQLQDTVDAARVERYLDPAEARGLAAHFVGALKPFQEDIDLANVLLVPRAALLGAERFPAFAALEARGAHAPASALRPGEAVLYLVHRWEPGGRAPDPDGRQFALVQNFLEEHEDGRAVRYVWLAWSCLPGGGAADGGGGSGGPPHPRRVALQRNVATAVFLSSHCLIVPSTVFAESRINGMTVGASVTDLRGFSHSAWFQVEVVCALLSCTKIYTAYSFANSVKFFAEVRPPAWHGDAEAKLAGPRVYGGMEVGGVEAAERLESRAKEDNWRNVFHKYWGIDEGRDPTLSLARVYGAVVCGGLLSDRRLLVRAATCALDQRDLAAAAAAGGGGGGGGGGDGGGGGGGAGGAALRALLADLGGFGAPADAVPACQLLLFVLLYSMGKGPSKRDGEAMQGPGPPGCAQS